MTSLRKGFLQLVPMLALMGVAASVHAAAIAFPGGSVAFSSSHGQALSGPLKTILFLTALSLLPAMLVAVTSFTRIIIVLAMLRQAIGMTTTPPNVVLIGLAFFLTIFTMSPVIDRIDSAAVSPYLAGKLSESQAVDAGSAPLKEFLIRQTRERDIALIFELSHKTVPESAAQVGMFQLIPAFMLSELRSAFEIGFIVFLPFILIDIVVASVLMSLGMIMVPPLTLSLPLKILMFVLIDGWSLLVGALVRSFH
ncbi:flagellar type III secretion system pore protein FliP [Nevskia soli]|uniref:flagellar type III secretion system pore protein FliP n=1 Tax=Nevskia soli TaxID=418856 RepID=UPI0004A70684|nr:flagellar type III secretion system pore protein FliP [Nevskia soli]